MNSFLNEFEDHVVNAKDIHTPSKTIRVQIHDKNPWYDQNLWEQINKNEKREQICSRTIS